MSARVGPSCGLNGATAAPNHESVTAARGLDVPRRAKRSVLVRFERIVAFRGRCLPVPREPDDDCQGRAK